MYRKGIEWNRLRFSNLKWNGADWSGRSSFDNCGDLPELAYFRLSVWSSASSSSLSKLVSPALEEGRELHSSTSPYLISPSLPPQGMSRHGARLLVLWGRKEEGGGWRIEDKDGSRRRREMEGREDERRLGGKRKVEGRGTLDKEEEKIKK